VLGLPAVLALFFGLAAVMARPLWSGGWGRIAALAACLGITEWARGVLFTGFPWNAIGYLAMPAPLAMQTVTIVGVAGMSALAVLVFAMPALIGTRAGLRSGCTVAVALTVAHLGFGGFVLHQAPQTDGGTGSTDPDGPDHPARPALHPPGRQMG
jgi:apolipoprotein N-acyltransferase